MTSKLIMILIFTWVLTSCNNQESQLLDATSQGGALETFPPLEPTLPPSPPTGLSVSEAVGVGMPKLTISGVTIGSQVNIYSNSSCQGESLASVMVSSSNGDVSLSVPLSTQGSYTFFATTSNSAGNSACSSASASYVFDSCPDGYVPVPHNAELGTTKDFCVMKYEAKSISKGMISSVPDGEPYVNVDHHLALSLCEKMGPGHRLINNAQWMTIARNLESVPENWVEAPNGQKMIPRGHSDSSPEEALEAGSDPYHLTENDSSEPFGEGGEQKRTLILSNGETLWDFAGNVWERINWSEGEELKSAPVGCEAGVMEFRSVDCSELSNKDFKPGNPFLFPSTGYDSKYGLGQYHGASTGAAVRGGSYRSGLMAGIFALGLHVPADTQVEDVGFRCVYAP